MGFIHQRERKRKPLPVGGGSSNIGGRGYKNSFINKQYHDIRRRQLFAMLKKGVVAVIGDSDVSDYWCDVKYFYCVLPFITVVHLGYNPGYRKE